jgi:hypothetical protein
MPGSQKKLAHLLLGCPIVTQEADSIKQPLFVAPDLIDLRTELVRTN